MEAMNYINQMLRQKNWILERKCRGLNNDGCNNIQIVDQNNIYVKREYLLLSESSYEDYYSICQNCGKKITINSILIPKKIRINAQSNKINEEKARKLQNLYEKNKEMPVPPSVDEELLQYLDNEPVLKLKLLELANKQETVKNLRRENGKLDKPILITVTGTPRSGKTTSIEALYDFLKKTGFKTTCLQEPAGLVYSGLKSVEEKEQLLKDRVGFVDQQYKIAKEYIEKHIKDNEVLICDRGIYDPFIWYQLYYQNGLLDENIYDIREKLEFIKKCYSYLYMLRTTSNVSCRRDVLNSLSLAPRTTANKTVINSYNEAMESMADELIGLADEGHVIETTNLDKMDASINITNNVLDNVVKSYQKRMC